MSFSAWLSALEGHATTAAGQANPAYSDVLAGAPIPRGRCVRLWWDGEVIPPPQLGARYSLSSENVGHSIVVGAFEPLNLDEAAFRSTMLGMQSFFHALRVLVDADRTLGGTSSVVEPEAAVVEFAILGGTQYAFGLMAFTPGHLEYAIGD
jgi:hypothetical protein